MKITRSLISAASALALFAGTATPAFAYVHATPPVTTTTLRQRAEIRELYADAFSSILELANMHRGSSTADTTGRSLLARAQVRAAQRNYRRHVLGYLRGVDYRVLNVSGDVRRRGVSPYAGLPLSLVTTGRGGSDDNFGSWLWDRPTRRDIRENNIEDDVTNRDRDVLNEIENSSR
ncbi:MAG: hypothetical protein KC680_03580 [Candidatus Peregrinibacteria bacterium]|nr:hypothetical protein [Candidatus Peregrinibacteria bacterium]MCB9808154.1 hypothetical protein [Candidatus Peribacteria bacterium]